MGWHWHEPVEIVSKLRTAEAMLSEGVALPSAARAVGISQFTLRRWMKRFTGMNAEQVAYTTALERENVRLRQAINEVEGEDDIRAPLAQEPQRRAG